MYATDRFEEMMLNLMNGISIAPPQNGFYLALFMSDPGDLGEGYEVEYDGYHRMPITFSTPAEYGTGLAIENVEQITFAESPINVGNITHVGIMTDIYAGEMWLYGALDTVLNIQQGVTPIFRPGSVRWIWSGNLGDYYRRAIMNVFASNSNCDGFNPYVGLCNGNPEGDGAEFAGYDYHRFRVRMSTPVQQPNGTAMCQNLNEIVSNEATGNWGTLSFVCIYDAYENGNIYAVIPLNASFVVTTQTSVGFHIGNLRFSIN